MMKSLRQVRLAAALMGALAGASGLLATETKVFGDWIAGLPSP
jgi:hypothetical protein